MPFGRQKRLHRLRMPLGQLPLQSLERARPRRAPADRLGIDQALAQPRPKIIGIGIAAERPMLDHGPRRRCRTSATSMPSIDVPLISPSAVSEFGHRRRPMLSRRSFSLCAPGEPPPLRRSRSTREPPHEQVPIRLPEHPRRARLHPPGLASRRIWTRASPKAASPPISASTARPRACMWASSCRS